MERLPAKQVCVVLPVKNGAHHLAATVAALDAVLEAMAYCSSTILVAENGSTDATPALAASLARKFPRVRVLRLPAAGRGGALRAAWTSSSAEVLAYMDVDSATDLVHLPELLESVLHQRADIAIGSRLQRPRQTRRGWRRELLSRGYSVLVGRCLGAGFQDAQCGFKAVSRRVVEALLPLVENQHWFFDTELLTLAEQAGCRIHEFPVRWEDHAETSTVKVVPTILQMLRGIARLKRRLRNGLGEEARARWQAAGAMRPQRTIPVADHGLLPGPLST